MSSNLLIFDADYVAELTAKMNTACELMAEAVSSLKSAQSHENWKCKERTRILEDFDELNLRLGRLDSGVNDTTRILGGSVSRFAALESRYESQADGLSDELTSTHGYAASVRTEGNVPGQAAGGAAGAGTAGVVGAAGATGGESNLGSGYHGGHGHSGAGRGAAFAGSMAGRIPGMRPITQHGSSDTSPNTSTGGAVTMNVNLPVTHIPDTPDAAAKGIKDTREIAQGVVNSVAQTMAQALAGQGAISTPDLAEAYNAGRTVFENSAAIMSSPNMPHTEERLAMASGLVTLAGSAAGAGITTLGQAAGSIADTGASNLAQNAGIISDALQGNNDAHEFREVLGIFASDGGKSVQSSGTSSGKASFFDMIVAELKKAFSGTQDGSTSSSIFSASLASTSSTGSSLSSSSPIMEFLGTFVMDQAV